MRHGNVNRKFGRERGQRKALMRSLMRSLVLRGRMQTTLAKAKEVRPMMEKLVTRGRSATVANRRHIISVLGDVKATQKLLVVAKNYDGRAGGYLRIVKMGPRKGDAAQMAVIEFV